MAAQQLVIALAVTGSCINSDEARSIIDVLQKQWHCRVIANFDDLTKPVAASLRAQRLFEVLSDPSIDFVWVVRGGEGAADVLPYLHQNYDQLLSIPPKRVMGLSDATALLLYLNQCYRWPTIYGSGALMLARQGHYELSSIALTQAVICQQEKNIVLTDLQPLNSLAMQAEKITTQLCVGNMSLLAISIKDIWEFDARDKILIIEDWHERGYVIDRTLKYFKRIGKLDGIKALVLGDFLADELSGDPVEQERQVNYLNKVLKRFAEQSDFPVLSTVSVGHGRVQVPMPMEALATLQCGLNPTLEVAL